MGWLKVRKYKSITWQICVGKVGQFLQWFWNLRRHSERNFLWNQTLCQLLFGNFGLLLSVEFHDEARKMERKFEGHWCKQGERVTTHQRNWRIGRVDEELLTQNLRVCLTSVQLFYRNPWTCLTTGGHNDLLILGIFDWASSVEIGASKIQELKNRGMLRNTSFVKKKTIWKHSKWLSFCHLALVQVQ